jgi:hypothetical protein
MNPWLIIRKNPEFSITQVKVLKSFSNIFQVAKKGIEIKKISHVTFIFFCDFSDST